MGNNKPYAGNIKKDKIIIAGKNKFISNHRGSWCQYNNYCYNIILISPIEEIKIKIILFFALVKKGMVCFVSSAAPPLQALLGLRVVGYKFEPSSTANQTSSFLHLFN